MEVVYNWARLLTIEEAKGLEVKIGVHGISVGGLAATHLGRSGAVDFMMIDRSFSSLVAFPEQIHWLIPPIMRLITLWENPNCAKDYLNSTCYKVIA